MPGSTAETSRLEPTDDHREVGGGSGGNATSGSNAGSIYVALLEAGLGERESSWPPLSASQSLAQVVRHRRKVTGSRPTAVDRGCATMALADQVAYDAALIAYARRVGIECDPLRFGNPGIERRRIEGMLESRGISLDPTAGRPRRPVP